MAGPLLLSDTGQVAGRRSPDQRCLQKVLYRSAGRTLQKGGLPYVGFMSRIGRPSKGDRVVAYSRPHRTVREACEANARSQGYASLSDYIAAVLAVHEGFPDLAPQPTHDGEELPLTA